MAIEEILVIRNGEIFQSYSHIPEVDGSTDERIEKIKSFMEQQGIDTSEFEFDVTVPIG